MSLAALLAFGLSSLAVFLEFRAVDAEMRRQLTMWVQAVSLSVGAEDLAQLGAIPSDRGTPAFERVRAALKRIKDVRKDVRFVYLLTLREGKVVFLADSEPDNSAEISMPGDEYPEATALLHEVLQTGSSNVEGPEKDRWGIWVSAFASVPLAGTGRFICLGADVNASRWNLEVARDVGLTAWVAFSLDVLFIGGIVLMFYLRRRTARLAASEQRSRNIAECVSDWLWEIDGKGRVLYSSDHAQRIWGCPPEEILGRQLDDFIPRGDGMTWLAALSAAGNEPVQETHVVAQAGGEPPRAFLVMAITVVDHWNNRAGWQGSVSDITEAEQASRMLRQRDRLLEGAAHASSALLMGNRAEDIERVLGILGTAADVDRVYFFENHHDPATGALLMSQRFEWVSGGVTPQIENPALRNLPYDPDFSRWRETLSSGRALMGRVRDFPENERGLLEALDIRSIILAPILLHSDLVPGGYFLGFVGFDDCHKDREWNANETAILMATASSLGTAVLRRRDADKISSINTFLKSVLNSSKDVAIIATDDDGTVNLFNCGAETMLGCRSGEIVGRFTPLQFLAPEELAEWGRRLSKIHGREVSGLDVFSLGAFAQNPFDGDCECIRKDGARIVVHLMVTRLMDAKNAPSGYLFIAIDISERKRAENALRESEALHRTLLASLSAGVIIVDAHTHIIESVNPAAAKLLGAPESAILGKVCHQFMCPAKAGQCPITDQGMEVENADREMLRHDGSRVPVLKSVKRIQIGGEDKLLEVLVDISDRKRNEESLRLLDSAVRHASDSMIITTAETDLPGPQILFVNPAFTAITGYEPEDVLGRTPRMFQGPATDPGFRARIRAALSRGDSFKGETINYRKDGVPYSVELHISPVRDNTGAITRFVAIQRDVTSRHRFEQVLRQKTQLIETISRAQTEFIEDGESRAVFGRLLREILAITSSDYGFIGEVHHDADGEPYLKTHAMTNIAWDEETRQLFAKNSLRGFEFRNMKTLFGTVITGGKPVIANAPSQDSRSGGLPAGHPEMSSFMGLPFLLGDEVVGMLGMANRPGGYDETLAAQLEPLLTTCTSLIRAHQGELQRRAAANALRESEERIRNILDTVADGIITISAAGLIEVANPALARIFGYAPEEMLGKNVSLLMPEPDSHNHNAFLARYIETGEQHVIGRGRQLQALRATGEVFPVELAVSELFASGRRLYTGIIRDITERVRTETELEESYQRELLLRRRIQETLLFGKRPENVRGLSVGIASFPSNQVDGDFYDFFEYSSHCLDVVVGDIMGKGTTAALLGAATKNHFLRARTQLPPGVNGRLPDPADIVNQVHAEVTPEFARPDIGVFVTLFYARFDMNAGVCTFVDCGHTKTLQLHLDGDHCGTLEGENMPVGVLIQEHYEQHCTVFAPGDVFVIYSDGITEAHNPEGLYFGVEGIENVVLECRHRDSGEIVSTIIERTSEFTQGGGLSDDATCLVVKIAPVKAAACTLAAALDQIESARSIVQAFFANLSHAEVPEEVIIKAELGMVEALTNIVKHAFRFEEGHTVDMRLEAYSDRVCIRFDYDGPYFAPGTVVAPNEEDLAESGYGLFIVEQCFSQVEYFKAEDRRSAVLMTRNFHDE